MRSRTDFSISSKIIIRATAEIIAPIQSIAIIWHSRVDERSVSSRKGKAGVIGTKLTLGPTTHSVGRVNAEHLFGGQENEEDVGGRRHPTIGRYSMLDFVLDIAIEHGICWGVRSGVHPGTCELSIFWCIASTIGVLGIVLV